MFSAIFVMCMMYVNSINGRTTLVNHINQHANAVRTKNFGFDKIGPVDLAAGQGVNGLQACLSDETCNTWLQSLLNAYIPVGTETKQPAGVGDWWGMLSDFVEHKEYAQFMEEHGEAVYGPGMWALTEKSLRDKVNSLQNKNSGDILAFFEGCDHDQDGFIYASELHYCLGNAINQLSTAAQNVAKKNP